MRRLGEVYRVARNKYIVVKIDDPERLPRLGVKVFDEYRREIGRLLDIIGPVKQPYAVVKPVDENVVEKVKPGLVTYYPPPRPPRRRRGREREKPGRRAVAAKRGRSGERPGKRREKGEGRSGRAKGRGRGKRK